MKIKLIVTLLSLILIIELKAQDVRLSEIRVTQLGQLKECRIRIAENNDTFFVVVDGNGLLKNIEFIPSAESNEIDYYDRFSNEEEKGKISDISHIKVTYYSSLELREKEGKIASAGKTGIDYYTADPDKAGKIKSIGKLLLNYYTRQNDPAISGKISKVGNYNVEYFTSVSDLELQGKIMKIGPYSFEYFTQYNDPLKAGRIKKIRQTGSNEFQLIVEM